MWVMNADDADVARMVERRRRESAAGSRSTQAQPTPASIARRRCSWCSGAAARARRAAAARRPQRGQRACRVARGDGRRREHRTPRGARRSRDGLRSFRRSSIGSSLSASSMACSGSTTPSRRMSRRRSSRCAGMTRPTILLLGGRHKGEPYTALAAELERTGRAVIAYGEAAPSSSRISAASCRSSGSDRRSTT